MLKQRAEALLRYDTERESSIYRSTVARRDIGACPSHSNSSAERMESEVEWGLRSDPLHLENSCIESPGLSPTTPWPALD